MLTNLTYYKEYLQTDPVGFVVYLLYFTATILISLILHEMAHAYVALRCGDPTAKMLGRLSFRPSRHLDPFGTICMVLVGFGWAKPVPINPRNFRNGVRDDFLVSVAGICVNLTLFILCCMFSVMVNRFMWPADFEGSILYLHDSKETYYWIYSARALLDPYQYGGLFRQWYIRDLASYAKVPWLAYVQRFLLMMASTNLGLAIFNLLPIPPLDGYHVMNDLLLKGRIRLNQQAASMARLLLLVLIGSGVLSNVLVSANTYVYGAVLNLFLTMSGGA